MIKDNYHQQVEVKWLVKKQFQKKTNQKQSYHDNSEPDNDPKVEINFRLLYKNNAYVGVINYCKINFIVHKTSVVLIVVADDEIVLIPTKAPKFRL
jgi:hypothetical protein